MTVPVMRGGPIMAKSPVAVNAPVRKIRGKRPVCLTSFLNAQIAAGSEFDGPATIAAFSIAAYSIGTLIRRGIVG